MTSLGKAMAGRTQHRARIRVQPREIVDEYRLDSKLEFNVRAGDSWAYPDLVKRVWRLLQSLASGSRPRAMTSAAQERHSPLVVP